MKNTTFRKKALLSSVAMLLVALVALGSATFAWFSSNKTVTASGMNVTSGAAQGLVISNNFGNSYHNSVKFLQGGTEQAPATLTLTPVSVATNDKALKDLKAYAPSDVSIEGGGTWKDRENDDDVKGFTKITLPSLGTTGEAYAVNDTQNFVMYQVKVKSTGNAVDGVKGYFTFTGAGKDNYNSADYIRIAVIDGNNDVIATYGNEANNKGYVIEDTDLTDAVVTPKSTEQTLLALTGDGKVKHEFVAAHSVQAVETYTFLVWYEGEDVECIDKAQQLAGSLEIKFTCAE